MNCCCGAGVMNLLSGINGKPYTPPNIPNVPNQEVPNENIGCWFDSSFLNSVDDDGNRSITIPASGFYSLSLSSNGANANQAANLEEGTAFYVGYFEKGQQIDLKLGNRSFASFQDLKYSEARDVVLDTKTQGSDNKAAGFVLRWIGKKYDNIKAIAIDAKQGVGGLDKWFKDCSGGRLHAKKDWWYYAYFQPNGKRFVPPPTKINDVTYTWDRFKGNTVHWYYQDVLLSAGRHDVIVVGDDRQRLAIEGVPVVWSTGQESGCARKVRSGAFYLKRAGKYRLICMQVNIPDATPTWTAIAISNKYNSSEINRNPKPFPSKIEGWIPNLTENWNYISQPFSCENEPELPTMISGALGYTGEPLDSPSEPAVEKYGTVLPREIEEELMADETNDSTMITEENEEPPEIEENIII